MQSKPLTTFESHTFQENKFHINFKKWATEIDRIFNEYSEEHTESNFGPQILETKKAFPYSQKRTKFSPSSFQE